MEAEGSISKAVRATGITYSTFSNWLTYEKRPNYEVAINFEREVLIPFEASANPSKELSAGTSKNTLPETERGGNVAQRTGESTVTELIPTTMIKEIKNALDKQNEMLELILNLLRGKKARVLKMRARNK